MTPDMNTEDFVCTRFSGPSNRCSRQPARILAPSRRRHFHFRPRDSESVEATAAERRGRGSSPSDFNAFLRIGEDGRVTCFTGKIEMGQGIITSLPQMLAEELETPLASVDIVMGDTELCPWDMGTFGSMTTRLRPPPACGRGGSQGGAARTGGRELEVPQAQLTAQDGAIFAKAKPERSSRTRNWPRARRSRGIEGKPALKDVAAFKVIGKPHAAAGCARQGHGEGAVRR